MPWQEPLRNDYQQNSVSNWMHGVYALPRDIPVLLESIHDLRSREWVEPALAFAYGQRLPKENLEDIGECRKRKTSRAGII
jgi:hypothetical protein